MCREQPQIRTDGVPRPLVALVIHEDGPGGGPLAVIHQASWLAARYRVQVLAGGSGRIAAFCRSHEIHYTSISGTGKAAAWRFRSALLAWVRQARPALLVSFGQWGGAIAGHVARATGVTHIYVAEWPSFYTDWDCFRLLRNRLCERSACHGAEAVVALSESNAYQYLYRKLVDEKTLFVLPNPIEWRHVPTNEEADMLRVREGFVREAKNVVSVSRFSSQKCLHWLLTAWPLVLDKLPTARLWMVGDGELRSSLEELAAQLGIVHSCRFMGQRDDAWHFMKAADVVVATSMYEAFGYTAVEAMACGVPVVASRVDGLSDSLRHGVDGFLVRPGDCNGLADRVVCLLQDDALRERMGANGRARAMAFSVEEVMPQYGELYDRAVGRKAVASA